MKTQPKTQTKTDANKLSGTLTNSSGRKTFDDLGIAPKLLSILKQHKFVTPTPIQEQSIPPALSGSDLMGIAQTGTGKTLAFGIPMIQRLAEHKGSIGLVVLPTRELALQVNETLKKIGTSIGLKTAILIGGENIGRQLMALRKEPHIIIATPGRLIDHLEKKSVNLSKTRVLVLDEADRMLDMGFAPQIKKVLESVPKTRQTMLFSATMPHEIVKIANSYMQSPLRVEVAPAGQASASVSQEIFFLDRGEKLALLKKILSEYKGTVLVFSRTKYGAKKIARDVRAMGINSTEIHSNRSLNQRLEALKGFKDGKYRVLVATDIAARGIDVTGIELVLNYDLPDQAEDYVHRIGRTGRASMKGHAISFATHDQKRDVNIIERLIKKALPVSQTPKLERLASTTLPSDRDDRGLRGNRGSRPSFGGRPSGRDSRSSGGRPTSSRSTGGRPTGDAKPNFGSKPNFDGRPNGGRDSRPSFSGRSSGRPSSAPSSASSYTKRSSYGQRPSSPTSKPSSQGRFTAPAPRFSSPSRPSASRPAGASRANKSANTGARGRNKKWSEYERGRKPAPASLKKISPSSNGFFISKKSYDED